MKLELELAAAELEKYGKTAPNTEDQGREVIANARRLIREQTDALIKRALERDSFLDLAIETAGLALVVGGTAIRTGQVPNVRDFVEGARENIEDARADLDRALLAREWDGVRSGLTRLEITWRGVFACLGLPYDALLRERHRTVMEDAPIDEERVRAILSAAGIQLPPRPPANDPIVAAPADLAPGSLCPTCQGNVPCGNPGHPGNR